MLFSGILKELNLFDERYLNIFTKILSNERSYTYDQINARDKNGNTALHLFYKDMSLHYQTVVSVVFNECKRMVYKENTPVSELHFSNEAILSFVKDKNRKAFVHEPFDA